MSANDKPARRATIVDVAQHADVSPSTVSLVLQQAGRISKSTRERVEKSMQALGYTYNRGAASLRRRAPEAIGLVMNDIRNPFFGEMIRGMQSLLDETGRLLYLVENRNDPERQENLLRSLVEHGVGGLILCAATDTSPAFMEKLNEQNLRVCLAVRRVPGVHLDFVGADNYAAAHLATNHLIERGHRRIAFLGGEKKNSVRIDRIAGYFAALHEHGIAFDDDLCTDGMPNHERAIADTHRVLDLKDPPTAALAHNDAFGVAVMSALRMRSIEPGTQFAVVGFDGTPEAEAVYPQLTTVSLHPFEIGKAAADLVLQRMNDPDQAVQNINLTPTLIVRASSAFSLKQ